jgi:hypothetical protein
VIVHKSKDVDVRFKCLVLAARGDVQSLRDLRGVHVRLLRAVRAALWALVDSGRFGAAVRRGTVRMYLHYPPGTYHLHVHATHARVARGVHVERAHLLDDVIEALAADGEHFARASLTYELPAGALLEALQAAAAADDATAAAAAGGGE